MRSELATLAILPFRPSTFNETRQKTFAAGCEAPWRGSEPNHESFARAANQGFRPVFADAKLQGRTHCEIMWVHQGLSFRFSGMQEFPKNRQSIARD
jgi:hypothetical protein